MNIMTTETGHSIPLWTRVKRRLIVSRSTVILVALNGAVFLWMLLDGISFWTPNADDLLRFGATSSALILEGDWYRLFTAIFVHVGFIHIAANMWCLWNLGLLSEMLIGPRGIFAVYALTGIAGNLLSLGYAVQTEQNLIGAGASGAVFGIAGILIVLLSNPELPFPRTERLRIRKSVIFFALINLAIGGATVVIPVVRIDNFAHMGGFALGLILGIPLRSAMTKGRSFYLRRQLATFLAASFVLFLAGIYLAFTSGHMPS